MQFNKSYFLIVALALIITSCKKENQEYDPNVKAELSVEFDNIAGSSDLQLNTGTYTNALGQSLKVTKLKYFVSNFKLTRVDGTVYTVPQNESYFLIEEGNPAADHAMLNIPEGEYKSISFVLGVDSLRNTMDVSQRTGVLDVSGAASDMYWSWNSGYIFFRLDGTSPVITAMGSVFQYHIGGFGGYSTPTANNLRTITLDLSARGTAKVKDGKETNIHLMVDILKAISGTTNMDFSTTAMVHSVTGGVPLANNCTAMFTHDHTEN
ncbi:MAG TPA: hypothetical protein PLO99_13150 [Chitinophagaceae bacterium]|nr:hypothetical protein [Chitinophagaceae bacterium]